MILKGNQKGFTIIELLVVIVVIAILVALTLPNLFSAQTRARDTERKNDLKNAQQQLESYYNDNNSYPTTSEGLGLLVTDGYLDEQPQDPQGGNYTYAATTDGTTDCTAQPCAQYTLTADLENDNDADANASGDYVLESVNQ